MINILILKAYYNDLLF